MLKVFLGKKAILDVKRMLKFKGDTYKGFISNMVYDTTNKRFLVTNGKALIICNYKVYDLGEPTSNFMTVSVLDSENVILSDSNESYPMIDRVVPPASDMNKVTDFYNNGKADVLYKNLAIALNSISNAIDTRYLLNLPQGEYEISERIHEPKGHSIILTGGCNLGNLTVVIMPISLT